jgi:RNA polymerase sigma factor (sigma-70 family)
MHLRGGHGKPADGLISRVAYLAMPQNPASPPGSVATRPSTDETASATGVGRWAHDYSEDLRRFLAKRRFIESDIKDVCQEVYLRLLRFDRGEVIQNPLAYLYRVAANVAHDFRLRKPPWDPLEATQLDQPTGEPGPEQLTDAVYRNHCLATILASMPALPRAALVLHSQHDLTYEEIAARLGVTRRMVKRAIARGYALARDGLQGVM